MFLSVIIPVYNAETYLEKCLDSLLDQDIPAEAYEILCVNDGSKDSSLSILCRYAEKHPNIVILDKENGGVTTARNAGLARARGDYIWFVDADDLVKQNALGMLRALAKGQDRVIFGAYEFTDELSEEELALSQQGKLPTNTSFYDSVVWRCLLRREFLQAHNLNFRYPHLTHGEDGLFMYEVTLCAPSVVETEEVLYFYRIHSGSAETAATPESRRRRLRSLIGVCEVLQGYYLRGADRGDRLMTFLWMTLYDAARAPADVEQEAIAQLKTLGLFPFRRPAGCTVKESYMFGSGPAGRVLDKLYLNLHRPWGYKTMRLVLKVLKK